MIKLLPLYSQKSKITQMILKSIQIEFDYFNNFLKYLSTESFIETSVDYLNEREKVLGIEFKSFIPEKTLADFTVDELADFTVDELNNYYCNDNGTMYQDWLELRRSNIKSRLRGVGTVTEKLIQSIATGYTNGDVAVNCDFENYIVTIDFVSKSGKPTEIEQILKIIKNILPAHLILNFKYKFRIWAELKSKTWADFTEYTWQDILETEDIINGKNTKL